MKATLTILIGLIGLWNCATSHGAPADAGPLDKYIRQGDASYNWVKRREGSLAGGTYVELILTSQTWHGEVWKHQLFIFRPKELGRPSQAMLMVSGGIWRDELQQPAKSTDDKLPGEALMLATAANRLKAPVAMLLQVPRQPSFGGMVEDQLISYTFEQYLKTQDATWPLLLPMVKSTVRAMDAVQAYAKTNWQLDIQHFTLTGASKRGWTTWLTAAVDSRVNAIAPMVIDVLNMGPQMKHQVTTWGRFSEKLSDYTDRGIQRHMATPAGKALREIVDPYSYRLRLTQPKLILLGTNDRYWPLDALNLYWPGLEGEKHVLYVPNKGHSLGDPERVVGSICALHRQAAGEMTLPKLNWDLHNGDQRVSLEVRSNPPAQNVLAWVATSPTKDFRDARWQSFPTHADEGAHRFSRALPGSGYLAMFGEAVYEAGGLPYFLSTNVKIVGPPTKR